MTTVVAPDATHARTPTACSRAVGTAGTVSLLGALLVWVGAEAVKASDINLKTLKAQVTLVVAILTVVQLGLMVTIARSDMVRKLSLTRVHRGVGMGILLLGGFVTYLCFTGPFRTGMTLHRVAGFAVCAAVLVKITSARMLNSRWYLIATVGLILMAGLQVAFFTKSFPVLFGGK